MGLAIKGLEIIAALEFSFDEIFHYSFFYRARVNGSFFITARSQFFKERLEQGTYSPRDWSQIGIKLETNHVIFQKLADFV